MTMSMPGVPLGPERRGTRLGRGETWWGDDALEGQLDALTGLRNRVAWEEAISRGDEARVQHPLTTSVIFLDVDCPARAEGTPGPTPGDEVRRSVAGIVREVIRTDDLIARTGDDAFGVLLPGADETACADVVKRLRDKLAYVMSPDGRRFSVAVGSATAAGNETLTKAERWADARMFFEKTDPGRVELVRRRPSPTVVATSPAGR
jgi:diguanylate cyclase (GGDEF)-like protein